jgi:hypothetical protein
MDYLSVVWDLVAERFHLLTMWLGHQVTWPQGREEWHLLLMQGMPFFLSSITIWMNLMAGNKHPRAWLVGLFGQLCWLVWILISGPAMYGFLPMNFALWIVYFRNHLKWRKSSSVKTA